MGHFYRIYTVNDFSASRCGVGLDALRNSTRSWGLRPEFLKQLQELDSDDDASGVSMLRAPKIESVLNDVRFVFNIKPGVELPDIWALGDVALVSSRVKAVIESLDSFDHEFVETEVLDSSGGRINKIPYFHLNVRRMVRVKETEGEIKNRYEMFCPILREEEFLPAIQSSEKIKRVLSDIPIWRYRNNWPVLYVGESMLVAMRAKNISGLRSYTSYDGKPCESVARFE